MAGLHEYAAGDARLERHKPEPQSAALANALDLAARGVGVRLVQQPGDPARGTQEDGMVEVVLAGLVDSLDAVVVGAHAGVALWRGARQCVDRERHDIGRGGEVLDREFRDFGGDAYAHRILPVAGLGLRHETVDAAAKGRELHGEGLEPVQPVRVDGLEMRRKGHFAVEPGAFAVPVGVEIGWPPGYVLFPVIAVQRIVLGRVGFHGHQRAAKVVGDYDDVGRQPQERRLGLPRINAVFGEEPYDPVVRRAFLFVFPAVEAAFAGPGGDDEVDVLACRRGERPPPSALGVGAERAPDIIPPLPVVEDLRTVGTGPRGAQPYGQVCGRPAPVVLQLQDDPRLAV